jgi:hypothetical protein
MSSFGFYLMGLTPPQYLVMLALWGHSPLSVREIGSLLQLDTATLSRLSNASRARDSSLELAAATTNGASISNSPNAVVICGLERS